MRSKAIREEIKFTLKAPPTASLGKKPDPTSQFFQNNNSRKPKSVSNTIRAQDAKAL